MNEATNIIYTKEQLPKFKKTNQYDRAGKEVWILLEIPWIGNKAGSKALDINLIHS